MMSFQQWRKGKHTTDVKSFACDPVGYPYQKVRLHGILHEQTHFTYVLSRLEATFITVKSEINYTSMTSNKQSALPVLYVPHGPSIFLRNNCKILFLIFWVSTLEKNPKTQKVNNFRKHSLQTSKNHDLLVCN